ncbi:hypothetical protein ARMSODRAFT_898133, partial [Armillaria solidipes]
VLIYPWWISGGVSISKAELDRLSPGQYLNDNIIEFGLKRYVHFLEYKNLDEAYAPNENFIFSSFWYPRFKKNYKDVRRWTVKVDVFAKQYLIVPMHEGYFT